MINWAQKYDTKPKISKQLAVLSRHLFTHNIFHICRNKYAT